MDKKEFYRLVEKVKYRYDSAHKAANDLNEFLANSFPGVDLSKVPSNAENADNVEEALACYYQYGEYSLDRIYNELNQFEEERKKW